MTPADFPYRATDNTEAAAELLQRTETIRQLLNEVKRTVVSVGESIGIAQATLRPELFEAWLFSEFRWKPAIADAFIDCAVDLDAGSGVCNPAVALQLCAHSLAARELTKTNMLLEAYRGIVKGDATIPRPRAGRPRVSIKSPSPRIRGRVYRTTLRGKNPNTEELTD